MLRGRFTALNGAALVVGAVAGLAAVALRWLIDLVQNLAFSGVVGASPREENQFLTSRWGYLVLLVPALGGLLVGVIRKHWAETRQFGVTEVMAAVQAKGGILRGRTSWGHGIISAITVGTGGSTGREGPIGYIGAALGSSLGRRVGLSARDIKILLGCGFSSGIAASFSAPLGGVLMALELVLPEFSTHAFIPLVASTVVGVTIGHIFLADKATFAIPGFTLNSSSELLAFAALGLVCGFAAVAFIRLVTWSYNAWTAMRMSETLKPALGGLLVGLIGLTLLVTFGQYHVFGTGYATVSAVLRQPAATFWHLVPLLLVLVLAKPVATAVTVGSGGGGGMFSVSLFQGALWGGLVGLAAQAAWPHAGIDPASYALVGMGAFYAASTRATLTAIVILTELTRNYLLILPLMLAAVIADAVSVALSRESLYTIKLTQKGIHYEHDRVQSPLDYIQVKDVMSHKVETLTTTMTVGEAFNRMMDLGHTGYPVVDAEGKLAGILTRRDLSRHMQAGKGTQPLADVVSGLCITAFPDEMLYRARDRIYQQDIGRLIVVDPNDRKKVTGILTRSDLLRAEAARDVEHGDPWGVRDDR
ncbi:MAG TPA: chloride channel protein [Candidatus Thermoplasmatota archaeon]|nr:chloride channel protein [Candidatus Thermoplasmatota archaeon]